MLPRVLDTQMNTQTYLHPLKLSVDQRLERLSAAEMVLPPGERAAPGAWTELYTPYGSAGIFIAEAVREDEHGRCEVSLRHALCLLDRDVRPEDEEPESLTVRKALTRILDAQTVRRWQLGQVDYTEQAPWQTGGCTLLEDIRGITDALPGACLTFDMTCLPWTLNVIRLDDAEDPACELRLNRGVTALDARTDISGMATRLYPVGSGGLTVSSVNGGWDYIERGTAEYGVISAIDRHDDITDASVLLQKAKARLKRCSVPEVSVTVEGTELSAATGEPLDRMTLGRVCRLKLPGSSAVTERIVALRWEDTAACPERLRVTLANERVPVTERLRERTEKAVRVQASSSRRSARRQKKSEKTLSDHGTAITRNEFQVKLSAWARKRSAEMITDSSSSLTLTPDAIRSEVSEVTLDDSNAVIEEARSCIEQTAGQIVLSAKNIELKADKVTLDAKVVELTGQLNAASARITNLMSGYTTASTLSANTVTGTTVAATNLTAGRRSCGWSYLKDGAGQYHWFMTGGELNA